VENSWFGVDIDTADDFYTALMKFGDVALTSAATAMFCNESPEFSMPQRTWIEAGGTSPGSSNNGSPYANEVQSFQGEKRVGAPPSTADHGGRLAIQRPAEAAKLVARLVVVLFKPVYRRISRMFRRSHNASDISDAVHTAVEKLQTAAANFALYHDIDNDIDGRGHARLLQGSVLPAVDDSPDWEPSGAHTSLDADIDDGYEYDSDYTTDNEDSQSDSGEGSYDSYVDSIARQRRPAFSGTGRYSRPSRLEEYNELLHLTPEQVMSLVAPQSREQIEETGILSSHLRRESPGPLTRSQFYSQQSETARDLLDLVSQLRKGHVSADPVSETVCVVCHVNPRQVILWPCRCFALCNECRGTLATKRFKGCVCCRQPINSFSRVYVP
jgi:hypothetical protein